MTLRFTSIEPSRRAQADRFVERRKLIFVCREKRILLVAFSRRGLDFRRKSDGLRQQGKGEREEKQILRS